MRGEMGGQPPQGTIHTSHGKPQLLLRGQVVQADVIGHPVRLPDLCHVVALLLPRFVDPPLEDNLLDACETIRDSQDGPRAWLEFDWHTGHRRAWRGQWAYPHQTADVPRVQQS